LKNPSKWGRKTQKGKVGWGIGVGAPGPLFVSGWAEKGRENIKGKKKKKDLKKKSRKRGRGKHLKSQEGQTGKVCGDQEPWGKRRKNWASKRRGGKKKRAKTFVAGKKGNIILMKNRGRERRGAGTARKVGWKKTKSDRQRKRKKAH